MIKNNVEAPDRIFASDFGHWLMEPFTSVKCVEYIRADLAAPSAPVKYTVKDCLIDVSGSNYQAIVKTKDGYLGKSDKGEHIMFSEDHVHLEGLYILSPKALEMMVETKDQEGNKYILRQEDKDTPSAPDDNMNRLIDQYAADHFAPAEGEYEESCPDCGETGYSDPATCSYCEHVRDASTSTPADVQDAVVADLSACDTGMINLPIGYGEVRARIRKAITTLTALQADNERLRGKLEEIGELKAKEFEVLDSPWKARAEKAEAEREAWKANAEAFVRANEDGEVEVWLWQHPDFESTKGMQDLRMDLFRARTSNAKLKGEV